jgi:hypothetical protein
MENRSRLKRVAIGVISSASSLVDSRSTVWGGSVEGKGDFGENHRAQISAWNLAVYNEADIQSSESINSQGTAQLPEWPPNEDDIGAFLALIEEGDKLEGNGMLAEAERLYDRALKFQDIDYLERNAAKLRIVVV